MRAARAPALPGSKRSRQIKFRIIDFQWFISI
jgi:hypothetical protein